MNDLISKAEAALQRDLCDHCLGRLFALRSTGLTNEIRGRNLRSAVALIRSIRDDEPPIHMECWLCEDIFDNVDRYAKSAAKKLLEVEFSNYLIGTRIDPAIVEREERLWSELGGDEAEPIKAELNREIGKVVGPLTGKEVEFSSPDVVAIVDTRFNHVVLDVTPIFLYGRYRKLSREIPQTKWPCKKCRGKGCEKCNFTGKMYQTSVQEIIGDPVLEEVEGDEHLFHGMGREDIDALMLGTGRPFVLEVRGPKKRTLDLESLYDRINLEAKGRVEVLGLRTSSREEVRRVKLVSPDKSYRVTIRLNGKVDKEKLNEVVRSLKGTAIIQQTPLRVTHRRADKARERRIKDAFVESFDGEMMSLVLTTESGTYVKEFVHGDQGRTRPNLSQELGIACEVISLDVIAIADDANEVYP
ncbi:MAG: tRNA pseudouridine(54/55) synthase Pus10 [Methanomassiliicoccales archaeon]|nr:tRNA pseudouridine(54/55) synthase Pus10 [Methanomassiliicoccales archaeon]NYT14399.1 tRNA pseudouridine(54/55) synthase Pus10 [Methanomassiliicoccales archaeon]